MIKRAASYFALIGYISLVVAPLYLALDRLVWVAGFKPQDWINSLSVNYITQGVIGFTFMQAILSTLFTLLVGIPIAWQLGRHKWPLQSFVKSILTMPFVMPSIVAAMGFLHIIGPSGLNTRADESTWFTTLIIAHAWFNMALVIRFCEPVLSTLKRPDPDFIVMELSSRRRDISSTANILAEQVCKKYIESASYRRKKHD